MRVPAAAEQLQARRVGDDVFVTLTVPARNVDASTPADVSRVEVYAFTGDRPPPANRFLEVASRVGTIRVAPPGMEAEAAVGAPQGAAVTVRDVLTPEAVVPREVPAPPRGVTPPAPGALRRFYTAVAFSSRGTPGTPSPVAELPLAPLPDPPGGLRATYGPERVSLSWQPSGGLVGFLLDTPLPLEPPPAAGVAPAAGIAPLPAEPTRYNIYPQVASDPVPAPEPPQRQPWDVPAPVPLNPAPLEDLTFSEDVLLDERERCYVVRAVRSAGAALVEGDSSAPACIVPVDTFPPAPPTGLSAVAAAGAISLIWEPNTEPDLAGYLILRGEPGDATLARLTDAPISATRFTDRMVTSGTRYVYAVVAVDDRLPTPNVSAESARVAETAR